MHFNTEASISYQLMVKDSSFIIDCLKLLWRNHLLIGPSAELIPAVKKILIRERVSPKEIYHARNVIRENHLGDLKELI